MNRAELRRIIQAKMSADDKVLSIDPNTWLKARDDYQNVVKNESYFLALLDALDKAEVALQHVVATSGEGGRLKQAAEAAIRALDGVK